MTIKDKCDPDIYKNLHESIKEAYESLNERTLSSKEVDDIIERDMSAWESPDFEGRMDADILRRKEERTALQNERKTTATKVEALVDQVNKINAETGTSKYRILGALLADTAEMIPIGQSADNYASALTEKALLDTIDFVKDVNPKELLDELFVVRHSATAGTSPARGVLNTINRLNKIAAEYGLEQLDDVPPPRINSVKVDKLIKQKGEAYVRNIFARNAENGGEWFDRYKSIGMHIDDNVLRARDGDSWTELAKLADENITGSIMTHIINSSRKIGYQAKLGANPVRAMEMASQKLGLSAAEKNKIVNKTKILGRGIYTGVNNNPFNRGLRATRQLMSSAMLGMANFLTILDTPTTAAVLRNNGFSKNISNEFKVLYARKETRDLARAWGNGVMDEYTRMSESLGMTRNRMSVLEAGGDVGKYGAVINKVNAKIFRAYGIPMLTRLNRARAIGEISRGLAPEMVNKTSFQNLNPLMQKSLLASGIDEPTWARYLDIADDIVEGDHINPDNILDEDLWLSMQGYFSRIADSAVIQPNVHDDFILHARGITPDHPAYELMQTILQFKNFPYTYARRVYGSLKYTSGDLNNYEMLAMYGRFAAMSAFYAYGVHALQAFHSY